LRMEAGRNPNDQTLAALVGELSVRPGLSHVVGKPSGARATAADEDLQPSHGGHTGAGRAAVHGRLSSRPTVNRLHHGTRLPVRASAALPPANWSHVPRAYHVAQLLHAQPAAAALVVDQSARRTRRRSRSGLAARPRSTSTQR
jgi:hypothetical protein